MPGGLTLGFAVHLVLLRKTPAMDKLGAFVQGVAVVGLNGF